MSQKLHFRLFYLLLVGILLTSNLAACASPTPAPVPPTKVVPTAVPANILRIFVSDEDFAPLFYHDSSGQLTGLEFEMSLALAKEAGLTPEFVALPWSRALKMMENGEIDMMSDVSQTNERAGYMYWIGPQRTERMVLVVKKENLDLPIKTIDDLVIVAAQKDIQFGIQQDLFYSTEFNDRLKDPNFAKWFDTVPNEAPNPKKIFQGRILGWFQDETYVKYQIATDPNYAELAVHSFALTSGDVYFGISKKGVSADKLALLQAAYDRLEKNCVFDELRNRIWK